MTKKNETFGRGPRKTRPAILRSASGGLPVVGIPCALLYHRYEVLWKTFFATLGVPTVVSEPTNREIEETGASRAIDEMCLSVKIYFGHVAALVGKCDCVFVPRIVSFGIRRTMCTTFQALPDMTENLFRNEKLPVLSSSVYLEGRRSGQESEEDCYASIGAQLGFSRRESLHAYHVAKKAWQSDFDHRIKAQDRLLKDASGLKVLIVAHPYVLDDEYIGRPVRDSLRSLGVVCARADVTDRAKALERSRKISKTLKWELSRELVGGLAANFDAVDGVVLLSVYPCALDSMVNEMIVRKARGLHMPFLQLTLDAQTGTAGIDTRLESFVDILSMKKEAAQ